MDQKHWEWRTKPAKQKFSNSVRYIGVLAGQFHFTGLYRARWFPPKKDVISDKKFHNLLEEREEDIERRKKEREIETLVTETTILQRL